MKFERAAGLAGPSSSIGIMRFFDVDTGGPKITPEIAIGVTVIFIIIELALNLMG